MNKIKIFLVCMLLICSSFVMNASSVSEKTEKNYNYLDENKSNNPSDVEYWAVIVGISDYDGISNDLPVPDVFMKKIYDVLISDDKYDQSHVRLLLNDEAKRNNILSALDWLSTVSDSNDVVIFSYQGHGSAVEDNNGDESDGMDEGIVSWEGLDGFITDDELDSKFDKISCDGMFLIFHSCLSGGLICSPIITGLFDNRVEDYSKSFQTDIKGNNRVIVMSSMDQGLALAYPSLTNTVANGLKGLADKNFDRSITAEEVSTYAKNHVLLKFLTLFILYPPSIISFIFAGIYAKIMHGYFPLPFPTIYDGYNGELKIK